MGIPGWVYLRRGFVVTLLAVMGNACCAGQGQWSPAKAKVQGASSQTVSGNPFERVLGSHLAEWMKTSGSAKVNSAQGIKAQGQASGVRVNAPAFLAAPFATLPTPSHGGVSGMVAADFNHDGKMDAAVIREDGALDIFLNTGSFSLLASAPPASENASAVQFGSGIAAIYAADLNGDSFPDLIAVDEFNSAIIIWMGNGDGTFKSAVSYPVSLSSGANWANGNGGILMIGDFNKDGLPDLAIIAKIQVSPGQQNTLLSEQTWINLGDGTFAAGKEVDVTFNDVYQLSYGSGDVISNDGKTASAIVFPIVDYGSVNNANAGTSLLVMKSNADGTFVPPVEPSAPLIPYEALSVVEATNLTANFENASIKSGSLLGSGIPTTDLIVAAGDGAVYDVAYIAGAGNPTQAKVLIGAPTAVGIGLSTVTPTSGPNTTFPIAHDTDVVFGDFDGDGYLDALVSVNGTAYMFPNGGAAAFTAAPTQLVTPGGGKFAVADFAGDGYQSILWGDFTLPQVAYFQNLGAANASQAGEFYAAPTVAGSGTYNGVPYNVLGGNVQIQAAADLNGDGLLDVIGSDVSSNYLLGIGSVVPPIVVGINNGVGSESNEKSDFTFKTVLSSDTGATLFLNGYVLQPFTIKNGNKTSIVLSDGSAVSHALYVLPIDQAGNGGTPLALSYAGTVPLCNMSYADSGDVNGDGIPDIVVTYAGDFYCTTGSPGSGTVPSGFYTFLGNPDGTYQPGQFTALGTALFKVKLMNLSGVSGVMDAVMIDSFGNFFTQQRGTAVYNVYLLQGDGHGNFGSPVTIAPNYIASNVVAGDFNSDGIPDITITTEGVYDASEATILPGTGGVLQLAGKGNYNFAPGVLVDQNHYPADAVYADVNGDGTPDLVVSEFSSGPGGPVTVPLLQIYPNLGSGVLGPASTEVMSPYDYQGLQFARYISSPLFVGNWGSGGTADVLVQGTFASTLLLNQGAPALGLVASAGTANQGAAVTFTATLTQGGSPISSATGVVSFSAGGTSLGSAPMTSGVASLTTTALPIGSDVVTASYVGDADAVDPTATANVTVKAVAPAFTLTSETASVSIPQGATTSIVLTLTANATFSGPVNLTCSGVPSESSCTVSPSSVSLTPGQAGSATVVIATTAKNNHYQASNHIGWKGVSGSVSLAGLLLLLIPRRRRTQAGFGIVWTAMFVMGSLVLMIGCSSGDKYPGTQTGTSTLIITGTSGNITQFQSIALTVTSSSQ